MAISSPPLSRIEGMSCNPKKMNGTKVVRRPLRNDPKIAPQIPPFALPKTPAPAPIKKWGTIEGMIIAHPTISLFVKLML